VGLIVGVDTSSGKDCDVDSLQVTAIGQVQCANNVVTDGLLLVILTPIDVGAASGTGSVEDVGWLDSLKLSKHLLSVLHTDGGGEDLLSWGKQLVSLQASTAHSFWGAWLTLALEEGLQVASNPSLSSPDQEDVLG